jgi:predicted nucleic acid-binding protein
MVYKIFLDINIVVDFYVEARANHLIAQQIFELTELNRVKVYTSESVINTTAYILRKDFPVEELKNIFDEMLQFVVILPCNNNTIRKAYQNNIKDMEDAVLYQIALENGLDFFISNDIADFKKLNNKRLPVLTSPDFIKLMV